MKPDRKKWPTLAKAWDDYGHQISWDELFDMKVGAHGYVALAWMEGERVNYADLATPDRGKTWEMQNDGHEDVDLKTWKKAKVVPECDWLDIEL
jgi:outer membrane protease